MDCSQGGHGGGKNGLTFFNFLQAVVELHPVPGTVLVPGVNRGLSV